MHIRLYSQGKDKPDLKVRICTYKAPRAAGRALVQLKSPNNAYFKIFLFSILKCRHNTFIHAKTSQTKQKVTCLCIRHKSANARQQCQQHLEARETAEDLEDL